MYCWEAAKRSQAAITELLLFRKSTGVILRDPLPALQRLCANGPLEDCQVRMFVKQRALPSANVCEAWLIAKCQCLWSSQTDGSSSYLPLKKIFAAAKTISSLHDVPTHSNFLYPRHTAMRSEMLYTNGSFAICQERMFVKQCRKHGWSIYLLPKKIFILKQKLSNSTRYVLTP